MYFGYHILVSVPVSDLHQEILPPESKEPPVVPQAIEKADPYVTYTNAKLYEKLFSKLKHTGVHLLYLGTNSSLYLWICV